MITGSGNWWKNLSNTLQTKLGEGEFEGGGFSGPINTDINKDQIVVLNNPTSLRNNGQDAITSTAVNDIAYDPSDRQMSVKFQPGDGKNYNFINVSPSDYKELLKAPSKGKKMWEKFLHNPQYHDPKYPS